MKAAATDGWRLGPNLINNTKLVGVHSYRTVNSEHGVKKRGGGVRCLLTAAFKFHGPGGREGGLAKSAFHISQQPRGERNAKCGMKAPLANVAVRWKDGKNTTMKWTDGWSRIQATFAASKMFYAAAFLFCLAAHSTEAKTLADRKNSKPSQGMNAAGTKCVEGRS